MSLRKALRAQGGKVYNNAKKDVSAIRRGRVYEPTPSVKRREFREELDALERRRERERMAAVQRAVEQAHLESRKATRINGKPPRVLIVESDGDIFVSRDPRPLKMAKRVAKR
jgi:hypothetical protein